MEIAENQNTFSLKTKISFALNIILLLIIIILLVLLSKTSVSTQTKSETGQDNQQSSTSQQSTAFSQFPTSYQVKPTNEKTVKENDLPISLTILKNPVVYQWRGSVEGTLINKSDNSLTLANKGGNITISVNPKATSFFGLKNSAGRRQNIKLEEIKTGSYVRGEFWVLPSVNNQRKIEGSLFTLESAP